MRLSGKTALITGGTTGIGLATAQLFQQHGARVAITGLNPARLAAASETLGSEALVIRADAASLADTRATMEQVRQKFGGLDILFVNAGVAYPAALEAVDEEHIDRTFAVDFKGAFFAIQQAVPLMQSGGSIILTTSWLNEIGIPGFSILSAAKAALRSLARTLSAELAPRGIRINAVSPGAIATPIYGKMGVPTEQVQEMAGAIQTQIPLRRFGQPDEIANVALFLASSDSSYLLGAEIVADGGMSQL